MQCRPQPFIRHMKFAVAQGHGVITRRIHQIENRFAVRVIGDIAARYRITCIEQQNIADSLLFKKFKAFRLGLCQMIMEIVGVKKSQQGASSVAKTPEQTLIVAQEQEFLGFGFSQPSPNVGGCSSKVWCEPSLT